MPSSSELWKTRCPDQLLTCIVWPDMSSAACNDVPNSSQASLDTQASPLPDFREDH